VKQYPSISRELIKGTPFYMFDKLDGSNIRAEWSPKKGFWKFGSRTQLIDMSNPLGKMAIPLIKAQEAAFAPILGKLTREEAICFFEAFGPSSFAGVHDFEEKGHQAVLIDVSLYKKGFMRPQEFLEAFSGKVPTPTLIHAGTVTQELVGAIHDGLLLGVTFEGVVCKGAPLKKGYPPHMFKIKSRAWIEKVKSLYTDPKTLEALL